MSGQLAWMEISPASLQPLTPKTPIAEIVTAGIAIAVSDGAMTRKSSSGESTRTATAFWNHPKWAAARGISSKAPLATPDSTCPATSRWRK
jgi:hypothetical protein